MWKILVIIAVLGAFLLGGCVLFDKWVITTPREGESEEDFEARKAIVQEQWLDIADASMLLLSICFPAVGVGLATWAGVARNKRKKYEPQLADLAARVDEGLAQIEKYKEAAFVYSRAIKETAQAGGSIEDIKNHIANRYSNAANEVKIEAVG